MGRGCGVTSRRRDFDIILWRQRVYRDSYIYVFKTESPKVCAQSTLYRAQARFHAAGRTFYEQLSFFSSVLSPHPRPPFNTPIPLNPRPFRPAWKPARSPPHLQHNTYIYIIHNPVYGGRLFPGPRRFPGHIRSEKKWNKNKK